MNHARTQATYALMTKLKQTFPQLEIESCASGGGRLDLGIHEYTERVWASDCIDALDVVGIHRGTMLLLPPEMVGTHVSSERSHTTGRKHPIHFRVLNALWGHMGVEADLTRWSDEDLDVLAAGIATHKRLRALLHGGTRVNLDLADPGLEAHAVHDAGAMHALLQFTMLDRPRMRAPEQLVLDFLDPAQHYEVRVLMGGWGGVAPAWANDGSVVLSGSWMNTVGLQVPALDPGTAMLIELKAVPAEQ